MKMRTRYAIALVLILSFFNVSFKTDILQDEVGGLAVPSSKLTATPMPKDAIAEVDLPTQEGVDFAHLLIQDSFTDNKNEWQTGEVDGFYWKGTREIKDGTLQWDGVSANGMLYSYDFPNSADLAKTVSHVQVSTRVKLDDPGMVGYIGLMVRGNETEDWNDYYFFGIETGGKMFSFLRSSEEKYKYLLWEEKSRRLT